MSIVTFSRLVRALVLALLLSSGCGSESSNRGAGDAGDAGDAEDVEAGEPPRDVRATTDDPTRVRVTWAAPQEPNVTAYKLYRDGGEIAQLPATTLQYSDEDALEAELAAPLELSASDGTSEDAVTLEWKASNAAGKATSHVYTVRALRDEQVSPLSAPATGSRPGALTGYDISFDDGKTWHPQGLALSYVDSDAPRAPVTLPAPKATPDPRSSVRLELVGAFNAGSMPSRTYLVRARSKDKVSEASSSVTGKRKAGRVELLAIQWQRSLGESAADFSDMPNVTGSLWFDAESAASGPRHYRARVASTWAEGTSSAVSGRQTLYLSVVAGSSHTCALRASDSKVLCWGHNGFLQAPIEPSEDAFESVAAGDYHSCGLLKQDGRAVCWGRNLEGQAPPGPSVDSFTSLSSHGNHTCGLRSDGKAVCWGDNRLGQTEVPDGVLFESVSAGEWHTCGVRQDGKVVCWGDNQEEQAPRDPSEDSFQSVSAGSYHSCGVRSDGRLACWGGKLAPPLPGDEPILDVDLGQVPELWKDTKFKSVVASYRHTCALREDDGKLVCWGQTAPGDALPGGVDAFTSVGMGFSHACAVREDGRIQCWGTGFISNPAPVLPSGASFERVTSGALHTCGLEADGKVSCWGGIGPYALPTETFDSLAAGTRFTCGLLRSDQRAVCWGANQNGQAPPGPSPDAYASLSAGYAHACGVRAADKAVLCWGDNSAGQASRVEGAFRSVAAGGAHTCAIPDAQDAPAVCWGDDSLGQATPPSVPLKGLTSGAQHSCGIRAEDGKVVCWGENGQGQAPSGPSQDAFKRLAAGYYHTCGIRELDDRLVCWGSYGEGEGAISTEPSVEAFLEVSGGILHTCALRASDHKMICMGHDPFGAAPQP